MKFHYPKGSTPLDLDEIEGLIPKNISLQAELNTWEQMNIQEAKAWAFGKKHDNLFSIEFIQTLHKKMFDQTWKWAGSFRTTLKNIGVEAHQVQPELRKMCDDFSYQITHKVAEIDEIVARLHHRLVWIHPFPNGNGRHARLYADIVLVKKGKNVFSWGKGDITSMNKTRDRYIEALRQADQQNFELLLNFVRS